MDMTEHAQSQADKLVVDQTAQESVIVSTSDAPYSVSYTDDGVFLDIIGEVGDDGAIDIDSLMYDLVRRNIAGFAPNVTRIAVRRGDARFRLGGPQQQKDVNADIAVYVASDEMTAYMTLLPPVGAGSALSFDEILGLIKNRDKVTYGLDESLIRHAVDNKLYFKRLQIAKGKPSEKGKDGELFFNFTTERRYVPEVLEDGSVDYKSLKVFERVSEGDVVVTCTPPEDGIAGMTVKGRELLGQRGREKKLPKGKNIKVSDDGYSLIAMKSGRVDYINNRVEVSDVYNITGDVNLSVGNVVFDGDVIINGNVLTGFSVEAAGSIEVRGYVEAAALTAGKDIILRNGMQGMSQGVLKAGNNIVARFIERSTLSAKNDIIADYIVHCNVTAGNKVIAKGKWGRLLGGVIRAGKEITANTIGSPSNETTHIELGILPDERARYTKLDAERGQVKAQLNRIQNITRMAPSSDIAPERALMRQKLLAAGEQLEEQYDRLNAELEQLKELLSTSSNARVNALRAVYPNVKIQIDSGIFNVRSTIEFATFRFKDGQVGFAACEIKA